MNHHANVIFQTYPDAAPEEGYINYFPAEIFGAEEECMNVLVTLYDEEASELQATLESIARMTGHVRRKVRVVVIQDGWHRASLSLKNYFRNMLVPNHTYDWDNLESVPADVTRTVIIQPTDEYTADLEPIWVSAEAQLHLTLVIKSDNRMKHNSHSWFMRAFCREYRSKYLFTTDVGTTHHPECLARLDAFMDRNPGVAGCHGYPWIAEPRPHTSWAQRYLRSMQEYELGPLAVDHDRGFQSLFGFQQTLSGPCTFLRTDDATYPSLLTFMRDVFERDPSLFNILSSNLNIVEDTALTLYLFATSGKKMALVPNAYYFYDVETEPRRFVTQRRRWMNGVGCGLIIFWRTYPRILKRSFHSKQIQYFVRVLLVIGIAMQVLFPFIQPALFAYAVFQSMNPNFCSAFPHVLRSFQETYLRPAFPWLPASATGVYVAAYLTWTLFHSRKQNIYSPALFWPVFLYSHTFNLYSYYAVLIVTIQVAFQLLPLWQRPLVAFLIGAHYVAPIACAAMKRDTRTLKVATFGLLTYLSFFPMWSFMYGYNIARLWDVTWGNRLGGPTEPRRFMALSHRMTYGYLVILPLATGAMCFSSLNYNASYLHAIYVVPWYLLSSIMGVASIAWTLKYQIYEKEGIFTKQAPAFKRVQRMFTFGKERSTYIM